jgi:hypothetical protein
LPLAADDLALRRIEPSFARVKAVEPDRFRRNRCAILSKT